jgi:predicted phosphate transport protein (TIGR00153 family)
LFKKPQVARIFGISPIRPLQHHMEKVVECVSRLVPFFEAVIAEDEESVEKLQQEISNLEREADDLKKAIRMNLPKSFLLPVPRSELLDVLLTQDKVANQAKDVAGLMRGRHMRIPPQIAPDVLAFVIRCVDAAQQAQKTVKELDELVETGFRGQEIAVAESMLKKLDLIESDTDRMQVKIRSELHKIENDMPPIEVMFLYKVLESIGDLGDLAQRVGSRLQLMLAR